MKNTTLNDFLNLINYSDLNFDDFSILANATALNEDTGELLEFYRGPLLYSLISMLKPKQILEFGTGFGYSALCMAKALTDSNINGKIYTIDRKGNDEKIFRYYQLPNERVPQKNKISNKETWKSIAPIEWIDKIIPLQGYSGVMMDENKFDNIDFCYVDGIHTYDGTKHDFLSFLKVASNNFSVLFDDYIDRDFYGVKEFIDKEVADNFDLTLINIDPNNELKKFLKQKQSDYGMVYLNYISNISALTNYNEIDIDRFLKQYRSDDYRIRSRRYNIEKKIPFLKNIKFKFWENNQ